MDDPDDWTCDRCGAENDDDTCLQRSWDTSAERHPEPVTVCVPCRQSMTPFEALTFGMTLKGALKRWERDRRDLHAGWRVEPWIRVAWAGLGALIGYALGSML